jgi:hypothetical protein
MPLPHAFTSGDERIGNCQQHALWQGWLGWLGIAALPHHSGQFGFAVKVTLLFVGRFNQELRIKHGISSDMCPTVDELTG